MVQMQEEELGAFADLTGEELADLVAFVHDANEQEKLSADQIPERFQSIIEWRLRSVETGVAQFLGQRREYAYPYGQHYSLAASIFRHAATLLLCSSSVSAKA